MLNIYTIVYVPQRDFSSGHIFMQWRHYVFGLFVCECVCWSVHAFCYLTNQWTEFHQTLVDDVVQATDELNRLDFERRSRGQGRYKVMCENLGTELCENEIQPLCMDFYRRLIAVKKLYIYLITPTFLKYLSKTLSRDTEDTVLALGLNLANERHVMLRYVRQFREIFTEEGRRQVKITHKIPGRAPVVTYTQVCSTAAVTTTRSAASSSTTLSSAVVVAKVRNPITVNIINAIHLDPNSTTGTLAMDTTNGQAHNNSTTNLPHRSARAQHLDMSRCWDVANFCPLVVTAAVKMLYNKFSRLRTCCTTSTTCCELVHWWCP